jgi:hypothetical protein
MLAAIRPGWASSAPPPTGIRYQTCRATTSRGGSTTLTSTWRA